MGAGRKLARTIFGEKVGEFKDASTYVKPGVEGKVIDVTVFSRKETDKDRQTQLREDAKIKEAEKECARKCELINQRKNEEIRGILQGQTLASNLHDETQVLARAGELLTEEILEQAGLLDRIIVGDPQAMGQVQQIRQLT